MTKIIFDTDIGDDIDDAFALALACSVPQTEILAVTTVFRNTLARAKQAAKLLRTAGKKNVPVYVGCGMPLSGNIPLFKDEADDPLTAIPCQYDEAMSDLPVRDNAVDEIIRLARRNSGDITIVTLGAMTNLAAALTKAPDIAEDIARVVSMGGWYGNPVPEWNILCDPVAADIVFRSGLNVYAVGLDVTLQCALEPSLLEEFRDSSVPLNKLLTQWLDKWFAFFNFEKSVMHDPLAMASVFETVCTFTKKSVRVVTDGDNRGAVVPDSDGASIFVADSVDKNKFYGIIRQYLL